MAGAAADDGQAAERDEVHREHPDQGYDQVVRHVDISPQRGRRVAQSGADWYIGLGSGARRSEEEARDMAASEELGIIGMHSIHFFVHDAPRSHRFYTETLGWHPVARAGGAMVAETGQACTVYRGGDVQVAVSSPVTPACRAARYLRRHPPGVGSLSFLVEDLDRTWRFLVDRDATPIHRIRDTRDTSGARFRHFSITTAIGDVSFRFVERTGWEGFAPGFEPVAGHAAAPTGVEYVSVDHITSNAPTMASVRLWMEHVLGMEQCWSIEFHTEDVSPERESGTGLRSVVMWDPRSGLKFPVNEPLQPFFTQGQINRFVEDNHGAGIQHVAIGVTDLLTAVDRLRERGAAFLDTPGAYYDAAPERLEKKGVGAARIAHTMDQLRAQGILIDGSPVDQYLIQIFMNDAATLYGDPGAGPFFYELLQRCGDQGFGEGNFRALFESIERQQTVGGAA